MSGHNQKHRDATENVETQGKTARHERKGTSRHQSEGRDLREDIERWETTSQCRNIMTQSSKASELCC